MQQAHVFITGRVQGVGFRYFTRTQAQEIGVKGWVRNLNDGRVEAVFCGSSAQVEEIINRCKKGPPTGQVDHVDVEYIESGNTYKGFEIKR